MTHHSERVAFIQRHVDNLHNVLNHLPWTDLARALEVLEKACIRWHQVFLAGNGGSAAATSHMADDLMKGGGQGFRAIALSDNVPLITAIASDHTYSEVFAGQLTALGQPSDVLIAFLGMGGGQVAKMADVSVIVPADEYGSIEDVHMVFDHLVTAYVRNWQANKRRGV